MKALIDHSVFLRESEQTGQRMRVVFVCELSTSSSDMNSPVFL